MCPTRKTKCGRLVGWLAGCLFGYLSVTFFNSYFPFSTKFCLPEKFSFWCYSIIKFECVQQEKQKVEDYLAGCIKFIIRIFYLLGITIKKSAIVILLELNYYYLLSREMYFLILQYKI